MQKIKCLRQGQSKGSSIHHDAARAAKFWLLDSPKKYFFAKRTQSCSMFTEDFEKQSAHKPHQNRSKPYQNTPKPRQNTLETPQFACPP
jgi:hypothetical protein